MTRNTIVSKWFCLLLFLTVGAVFAAYQWSAPYSIDVGSTRGDDQLFIGGFHQRETSTHDDYRWTGREAWVAISGIGRGRSWKLSLHFDGYRPPGLAPPRVRLKVNGRDVADFTAEQTMREYQFPVGASALGWDGNFLLQIESDVFRAEGDPRELGILVTRVTVTPDGPGIVVPSPVTLFLVVASSLVLFFFLRWMGASDKVSAAASTPVPLALGLALAIHRQYATWYSCLVLVLLAGTSIAALSLQALLKRLSGRWGWNKAEHRRVRLVLGLFSLSLACNLALAATPGFVGDIGIYTTWAWKLTTYGVHTAYLPHDLVEPINYLPLIPYLFSIVGSVYRRFFAPGFPYPLQQSTLLLQSMIKLPMITANIASGALIFLFVRSKMSFRLACVACVAFLFNPAILFDSAYGGQADAIHSLFALLAVILVVQRRLLGAWVSIALAALSKPQGALFLPLILFLTWRQFGIRAVLKGALTGLAVGLVIFSPFIYRGTWHTLQGYLLSIGRLNIPGLPAHTTMGAHNLWWVMGLGAEVEDTATTLSLAPWLDQFINPRMVGLALLAFFYSLALFKVWKKADERSVPVAAAFVGFACFMSLTQVHETYAFSVLPLLALVFPSDRRLAAIYLVLSITFVSNMVLHDWALLDMLGLIEYEDLIGYLRYVNALINVGVLAYWTVLLLTNWRPGAAWVAPPALKEEGLE